MPVIVTEGNVDPLGYSRGVFNIWWEFNCESNAELLILDNTAPGGMAPNVIIYIWQSPVIADEEDAVN